MTVHFHRRGTGPALVLIHGIGHRWQAWEPILDHLAEHHDVIAIDLPGFGRSPVPEGGMPKDMPATVAAMGEFFASLGLSRPHVAGNSLGGGIALELAAAGLAASATAFAPAGFFTEAERQRAIAILGLMRATTYPPPGLLRKALSRPEIRRQAFGQLMVHPDRLSTERVVGDALALRNATGFWSVAKASRRYEFAGTATVPVTVAWGTHDRILPPHQAERARERLPKARHVTLDGCGHVPMSDAPDLVARVVLDTTGAVRARGPARPPSARRDRRKR